MPMTSTLPSSSSKRRRSAVRCSTPTRSTVTSLPSSVRVTRWSREDDPRLTLTMWSGRGGARAAGLVAQRRGGLAVALTGQVAVSFKDDAQPFQSQQRFVVLHAAQLPDDQVRPTAGGDGAGGGAYPSPPF